MKVAESRSAQVGALDVVAGAREQAPVTATPGAAEPPVALVPPPGEAAPRRIRRYEELDGADGRGVFFRPHRFSAADLAPLRATVGVTAAGAAQERPLHDVSQNGVAFTWPPDLALQAGDVLRLQVCFDGHPAWSGEARVGSVRRHEGSLMVGASFEGALLDTDDLLQLREVRRWAPSGPPLGVAGKPWHATGAHRYKALVSELRLLLEEAEETLREFEAALPWHVMQEPSSQANAALIRRLATELGADVLRYVGEVDDALRTTDPAEAPALKEFSVRHLQRFLMQAPWLHRARHKPFGYPGDYEVMNFIYERHFEGATLFARAVGHAFMQTPVALAVRYRKDLMRRELQAILQERAREGRTVRFLSIASGPARELQELLSEMDELPVPLEIVLFDQDKGALAHAYRRLRPLADARFPGRVHIVFLNESIKRLLRDRHLFDGFHGFDAVYSCGLFDYLQHATAIGLAKSLYAAAAPGGKVYIANMVDHRSRWIMEHHLEWKLLYRSREQLAEIGWRAVPEANIRLVEEETGVNPFIELVRS